jgi:hypothetical protein
MFKNETPKHHLNPGELPYLNRVKPRRQRLPVMGCVGIILVCSLIGVVPIGYMAWQQSQSDGVLPTEAVLSTPTVSDIQLVVLPTSTTTPLPTASATALPTLDVTQLLATVAARATGTPSSTPLPTLDTCWFLTPSPTPSSTPLPVTPDAWALSGTATQIAYLNLNTPTFTPTATATLPRGLCDAYLLMLAAGGATLEPSATGDPALATMIPTAGAFPTLALGASPTPVIIRQEQVQQQPVVTIIYRQEIVYITQEARQPVQIVVTAPPQPTMFVVVTATYTASPLPSATHTATFTPTETQSHTPTFTATFTPTQTATETPTETPTPTATETPTETQSHTPTFTATFTPTYTATFTPTYTETVEGP